MPVAAAKEGARRDAQVIASHGQRFRVQTQDGTIVSCFARSRLGPIVCGDRVSLIANVAEECVIEAVHPRISLIYRSDRKREKPIAANVTQAIVVLAPAPQPGVEFIDHCLAAIEHAGVKALLLLNKIDLDPQQALQDSLLDRYGKLGYPVLGLCAQASVEPLVASLRGEASVLIGQSGVGKSTIVNALLPCAAARTGAVSRSDAGRHTTTHARLYRLSADTSLIDSPGMHRFGVQHIGVEALAACFVEFRRFLDECRFNDCRHVDEPDCAVRAAVSDGKIAPERMRSYQSMLRSLQEPREMRSSTGRSEPARYREEQDDEQP
jgi:ribosome biogenesis GTPase